MPFFRPVKTKKRSKHYDKVSHKCRVLLLKKVLCDSREIKESAQELGINYSTAKTLMRKYKYHGNTINPSVLEGICDWYAIYEVERKRCQYTVIDQTEDAVKIEDYRCCPEAEHPTDLKENSGLPEISHTARSFATNVEILQQVLFKN